MLNPRLRVLKRAGLPRQVEVVVLTIAGELIPLPTSIGGVAKSLPQKPSGGLKEFTGVGKASALANPVDLPRLEIGAEAAIGSPGSEIIGKADEWRPDLIVVGSHGHTALGRMFFGSVSQKVVNEARCSVRVSRGRIVEPDVPVRIIVGVDGSEEEAHAAVEEIAARNWPVGTEVGMVNSAWTISPVGNSGIVVNLAEWIATETERVRSRWTQRHKS